MPPRQLPWKVDGGGNQHSFLGTVLNEEPQPTDDYESDVQDEDDEEKSASDDDHPGMMSPTTALARIQRYNDRVRLRKAAEALTFNDEGLPSKFSLQFYIDLNLY